MQQVHIDYHVFLVVMPAETGHLMGYSCIKQWIQSKRESRDSSCPACKKPVTISKVVKLWVSNVVAGKFLN
jgi:hypothetical protein